MIEFGRLEDLALNGQKLDRDAAVRSSVSRQPIQFFIMELNRRRQLFFQGKDSTGKLLSRIGGQYTAYTMRVGRKRNRNIIDLFDTGEFYESFQVRDEKDGLVIEADTMKEGDDLQDRWGDDLLGLTDDSIERLAPEMVEDVQEYVLDMLLG